ncbi:hypothetical protein BBK82_24635 [Lentzea guizhouensis]|uniref:Knr4/Smi1-like domain-containing protein n=1 Tax=Lentzea guizhouensis TaxID=1586287 RepID=A0A1B2HM34_9PSEU|nr:SMI1/KNR4 family protein [Lentzea guizhouensis]ANZ38778.1 hypothetical protein BBK82_24635 [Lentzea guizhouensis]
MRADLAALAHELITGVAPGFDFLTLRASCSGGGGTFRLTAGPSDQDVVSSASMERLWRLGLDRPVVLELRVERDGTFEAVVTEGVVQVASSLPPTYTFMRKPPLRPTKPEISTLAEVEAAIGASLPTEVHELYARTTTVDEVLLDRPDEILFNWRWHLAELAEDPRRWEQPMLYAGPPDAVRPVQFHPLWVPVGANDWGDAVCVDLAPGPGGRVGQVIQLAGEGPLTYLADSLPELVLPDEYPGSEGLEDHFDAADRTPAALPPTLQQITVREPGDLDFGLLGHLTSLRELRVVRGGSVRLAALSHLPLERLEVSGYEIELPVCETLKALVVNGAHVELPSLPNLRVLDVSRADVDVESLPRVDYLVLNAEQWRRCSQTPAAAGLVGESSLALALAWAGERGAGLPREVIRGRASA